MRQGGTEHYQGRPSTFLPFQSLSNRRPHSYQMWLILAGLILFGCMVSIYFQWAMGLEVVFPHLYYLPILYAVYCWQWRGVWLAVLLGMILVGSHLLFLKELPLFADIGRAVFFVVIAAAFAFALGQFRRQIDEQAGYRQELSRRLEFIFDFTNSCRQTGKTTPQICRELIAAWPETVGGCIQLDGEEYSTENYRETPWHLQAPIIVRNHEVGRVKLDYLERHEENGHQDAFLRDTQLLTIITKEMGAYIEQLDLVRELLKVSESEQIKIGRELHDGLGQVLTGVSLMFEVLSVDMDKADPKTQSYIRQIGESLEEAIIQTRMISYGLAPVDMTHGGLFRSLRELADKTRRIRSIDCVFECDEPDISVNPSVAGHLFRITQEAVSSAVNHCKASQVRIELKRECEQVVMSVWDDGNHVQAQQYEAYNRGMDLMRYRACLIEAELDIHKDARHGSQMTCRKALGVEDKQECQTE